VEFWIVADQEGLGCLVSVAANGQLKVMALPFPSGEAEVGP